MRRFPTSANARTGILLASSLFLAAALSLAARRPQTSDVAASPLRLIMSIDKTRAAENGIPKFRVEFRNVSSSEFAVGFGNFAGRLAPLSSPPPAGIQNAATFPKPKGGGYSGYFQGWAVRLTDAEGITQVLHGPLPGGMGGAAAGPNTQEIPSGYSVFMPLDLNAYWSSGNTPAWEREQGFQLDPGAYTIEVVFTGNACARQLFLSAALPPCWQGVVLSNGLQFTVPKP